MAIFYFDIPEPKTRRSVKEFLADLKKEKLEAGEEPKSSVIEFLDILMRRVKEDATVSRTQEKDLARGIEWEWWSTEGQPSWYIFIQLLETQPK